MKFKNITKGLFSMVLTVVVGTMFCACNSQADTTTPTETTTQQTTEKAKTSVSREHRKIIIDTDTGADDSSALILAAKQENIEILGVTVLVGNVDLKQSTRNAIAALETASCNAPVYKGSADTYDGTVKTAFSVFGTDGMGDADLVHPKRQAENSDAVDFIINTIKENPNEVEIIALGPATNIAKAIKKAPDTMKNVKRIWSMGTAGLGVGNASPVAEFNVYADAEAYRIMLDSQLPITVIGLDMCSGEAMWTDAQFEELEKLNDTGKFVAKSFGKIREFYKNNGSEDVMNCDTLAMMCALYPDFVKSTVNTHASCITEEGETYSQVIFYKEGFTYDIVKNKFAYNTTLVTEVDKTAYFDNYLEAVR
ncbi:MAG: nucleoside hydrolase [Clostridia bacterium]|nr:nucleoside hydrolase [Clostridia bacterium]